MEDEAIWEGFQTLYPGSAYDGLHQSALCRAKADWLVGINARKLFSVLYAMNSCKFNDNVVRSLIDTIRVVSGSKLRITFGTGYEYEQSITPNIRGIKE